ncbi:MAG: antibiotic biosynthesis monooxygenase [Gemmatimonadaceae bacterium]
MDYRAHFANTVLPQLEKLDGFSGATVLRERASGSVDAEVVVMTRWKSMDDVRGFAGDTLSRAVVEPAAHACLTWADDRVSHYDIVLEE